VIVIGLTGGIATGKSTVARHLASLGARVVDADQLGHRSYAPGGPAHCAVIEAFGPEIAAADGSIDRRALGARVFANPGELKRLSAIVWPQIGALLQQELRRIAREEPEAVVVIEAAVLLEAGWTGELDELWVVVADREIATRRALSRGGLDAEAVRARMAAQLSNEERAARADLVLDNSGDLPGLLAQVESAWRRLLGRAAGGRAWPTETLKRR